MTKNQNLRFLIVRPRERQVEVAYAPTPQAVYGKAGLNASEVDHGMLYRPDGNKPGLGYVVYEYSLFVPAHEQAYWGFGRKLIPGNSVLYGFDVPGDTVDCPDVTPQWFSGVAEIERAIRAGAIERPRIAVNNAVMWEWPQPAPR